jgi:hypothetical protein
MAPCRDHGKFFHKADHTSEKVISRIQPFVRTEVLKLYGETASSGNAICPGEAACDIFQSATGKTRRAREKNACLNCDKFPTKTERYKKWQASLQTLVDGAMEIRRRRNSGCMPEKWQMLNLHFETLILVDAYIEEQEIKVKNNLSTILLAGFGLTAK